MVCNRVGEIYSFCISATFGSLLQIVHGSLDAFVTSVLDMGVNHGDLHILVPQKQG